MGLPTLLDIAVQNGSDAVAGLIDETTKAHPEIAVGYARTVKGLFYKTLVRTGLPTAGFRAANAGVAGTKGTYENRLYECFILNPRWECDKAVADSHEDGAPAYIANEAAGIMEAAFQQMAANFYYGTTTTFGGDASGFPGLLAAHDSTNMVVDASGTTESTCSSVWAVKFGPKDLAWIYGNNGQLALSELMVARVLDANSNPYTAYVQEILAHPGLQVGNIRNLGRIKKLTADSGKGLTDSLLSQLLEKFQVAIQPDAFLMSRRSRGQLQRSRTATNPTGQPAPIPEEAFGIPILVTDAIKNTETLAL
jgi:hypothetical protein